MRKIEVGDEVDSDLVNYLVALQSRAEAAEGRVEELEAQLGSIDACLNEYFGASDHDCDLGPEECTTCRIHEARSKSSGNDYLFRMHELRMVANDMGAAFKDEKTGREQAESRIAALEAEVARLRAALSAGEQSYAMLSEQYAGELRNHKTNAAIRDRYVVERDHAEKRVVILEAAMRVFFDADALLQANAAGGDSLIPYRNARAAVLALLPEGEDGK